MYERELFYYFQNLCFTYLIEFTFFLKQQQKRKLVLRIKRAEGKGKFGK